MQNFGLNCNYFSKAVDCGLNTQKPRGSYANMPGRRGKFGSRPLDLDLMAQRGWDLGSNLIRLLRIGRPWSIGGCGTAALVDGDQSPRRRTGETRRSRAISILRGSKRAGLWPGSKYARRRTRLGRLGGGLGFGRGPRRRYSGGARRSTGVRWFRGSDS